MSPNDPTLRLALLDWRDDCRLRCAAICAAAMEGVSAAIEEDIAAWTAADILTPKSRAKAGLRRIMDDHVSRCREDLSLQIRGSLLDTPEINLDEESQLVALAGMLGTGVTAIGALGAAAVAIPIATTTVGGFLFVGGAVAVSWPVFLTAGAGAVTLAALSPKFANYALDHTRENYRNSATEKADRLIRTGEKSLAHQSAVIIDEIWARGEKVSA